MSVDLVADDVGTGPAVVLLHAFPCEAAMWSAQREALVGHGWRVLTPDLRGFGRSPLGADAPGLDLMAQDVLDLLDRLDIDRCVLGGLSMGGYVAMAMLRKRAELVAGLVLADTKASADAPAARAQREALAAAVLAGGPEGGLAAAMLPALLGETTRARRPDVVARVTAWADAVRPQAVAWAQRAMAGRPDSLATLAEVDVPALVLWGAEDTLSPRPDQEAMLDALARGRGVELAGVGHLSAVEDAPAVSRALLDFVAPLRAPYV